ncbi:FixH family protein [Marinomonas sp. 15G1-11]|uniref:FixH family protein n=1 Tax=Marinomonas phaeophyticola TaxID=3004091 RepID=A0ABT4JQ09_9GAMM|nr:FixH family protein [Marinomonas sp. 15G1-11]MCZ2720315.1 FixH family protein [Marinomonas sp. 15G1-11]
MKITPWYKQFWPWFVISIPLSSMIVAVFQIYFALNSPRDLVKDNYYKEGLGINQELGRKQLAADLDIKAKLRIDNLTGEILLITENTKEEQLYLQFFHVATASKDFRVTLQKISENEYRGTLDKTLSGNWNMSVESDSGWQITGRLDLTISDSLDFNL